MTEPTDSPEGRGPDDRTAHLKSLLSQFLTKVQNDDGGWGYQHGLSSRTEPTSWVLLAMSKQEEGSPEAASIQRGRDWLLDAQLKDGSWSAQPEQMEGCWQTSLACPALLVHGAPSSAVKRGIRWLCDFWPAEHSLWWSVQRRILGKDKHVRQNEFLKGWSWTRGTASWVEPTSLALIALHRCPPEMLPSRAARRTRLGEALLYDRECPDGGWNCGNPMVYGVPGEPQVGPSVWALLALRKYAERSGNQAGIRWLEARYPHLQSPSSLALAYLCLQQYEREISPPSTALASLLKGDEFPMDTVVLAWSLLGVNGGGDWLVPLR